MLIEVFRLGIMYWLVIHSLSIDYVFIRSYIIYHMLIFLSIINSLLFLAMNHNYHMFYNKMFIHHFIIHLSFSNDLLLIITWFSSL